jgi:CheY-like chemotaxis protein
MPDRKGHVLVVDDEPMIRSLMSNMLDTAGYGVEEAEDGLVAIERLQARRPDLVLLDVQMPRLNGWGVLEHISTLADPPAVVLVSGRYEMVPPGHLNHYVTGCLAKPFGIRQLLAICDSAIAGEVAEPYGSRKETRRTFLVETTLLSENGTPLTRGQLVQLSLGGFRAEIPAVVQPGDIVHIEFGLPGRAEQVHVTGRVRWRTDFTLGAQIEGVGEEVAAVIKSLVQNNLNAQSPAPSPAPENA